MSTERQTNPHQILNSFLTTPPDGAQSISDQYRNVILAEMTADRIALIDTLPGLLATEGLVRARLSQNPAVTREYADSRLSLLLARQESFRLRLKRGEVVPRLFMPSSAIADCRDLIAATNVADPDVVACEQAQMLLQARELGWDIAMVHTAPLQRVMGGVVSIILFEGMSGADGPGLYREYTLEHTPHEEWQMPALAREYAAFANQLNEHIIPEDTMLEMLNSSV